MKKRLLAWLLLMAMLLTVGAVAAAETNPNAGLGYYPGTSEKGWISVECSTMSKMNPFLQTYSTEFSINRHIWDCLVKLSPEDNSIVPAAAESWESSEDGMNWTFHIRKGMKWVNSKGEVIGDVTANDFVFAWRQLLNPANAAEYYAFATVFKNGQAYYDYASGVDGAPEVKVGADGLPMASHRVYNLGNSHPENLLGFVDTLQRVLVEEGVLPADYDFEAHKQLVPMQPGDVPVTYADTSALERDFGYKPATPLEDGLRVFAKWYCEYYGGANE